jgi:hypothetical protein
MITSYTHPDVLVTVEEEDWKQRNSKETVLRSRQEIKAWKRQQALDIQERWEQDHGW